MVFLVLLINCLLGSEKIKHSDLHMFSYFFDRLKIIQQKLLPYVSFSFLGIVCITSVFGYFYYPSQFFTTFFDYLNRGYGEMDWAFHDILKFIILIFFFIDLRFFYYVKKITDLLAKDDIESAFIAMGEHTDAPMKSKQDVFNELIIWVTHNSLYRITLPLFYYLIGDLPLLLGYYLLYIRHKDLFRIWGYIVFLPVIFITIIGNIISLVANTSTGYWRAIIYYVKNDKLLRNTNCNYLAIVFMFSSSINLVFYNFEENKPIELQNNNKFLNSIEKNSIEKNSIVLKGQLIDRDYYLPIFVCITSFIFYVIF